MSQQLVKKGSNGKHENVMPKSWIEDIKDKNTGRTLVEILQGFNMYFLPYNGNTSATRCLVPTMLRKKGLWITYVKYDGNVYTEWYAANEIDDKSWGDSSNWRIGNNTLVGDITISANGNWVINGTETEFKAVGEKGNTPLIRVANNRLQVSYDLGDTYIDVTNNPVYTKFRWLATTGYTQANNVGRIQASTDEGKTWTNMSNDFINNLHISRYIGVSESLPTSGIAEGTIYAKGPYYDEGDTSNSNPIYRLWVYAWKDNTLAWQDNGEFTSISAGVVQEMGDSETEVMSQKAVSEKLSELGSKLGKAIFDNMLLFSRFVDNAYYIGYEEKSNDYCYFEVDVEEGVEYVIGVQARFISSETEILINGANTAQKYTPTYTGKLYVSLQKTAEDFYVCKSPLTRFEVESYKNYEYVDRFVEEFGSRTNCALSQKKSTELFSDINKSISLNKELLNGVTGAYSNLLFEAEFVDNAYYAAKEESSSAYCYFKVQVESGEKYRIGYKARFVSKETEIIHSSEYDYYDYTPNYTGVLYVSYNKTYLDEAYVCNASINDKWVSKYGDMFIPYAKVKNPTIRKQFIHKDVLNVGEYIDLGTYSVKYGDVYTLSFEVDILGSVVIGNGRTGTAYSYLEINNRGWYVNNNGIITTLRETSNIPNYYQVNIITKYKEGKHLADIFIQYAEDSYSFKDIAWNGYGYTPRLVYINSGTIKNIDFGVTNSLLSKDIFLFGDSYFNLDSDTWAKIYLERFENKGLFSGFGGCNSIQAYSSVSNLFSLKTPKYAVWCLGMNDGSDIDGTPSSAWLDNVEKFIRICESNFIVPILATIPTVPTINHESKNNYVRASGYRYIDFAKAVGASSDGVWSDNMLSSDGVHPTLRGFTALLYRALMDVPELLQ